MDAAEVEESYFAVVDAKLHGGMCIQLSAILNKILAIFPLLEGARPRSKCGIQALCSLHVALDKTKRLLQHCSECSKLYLAITGDSILIKFDRARCALQQSLRNVEEIVPQAIRCQIMEIIGELERIVFELDLTEKKVGDEMISLLQKEKKFENDSNDGIELEVFHHAVLKLGITSSRAALTERRALKKLIERARAEEDKRKESIIAYLLHLMRKYSKLFRTDMPDDSDSQGSGPCTPTVLGFLEGNNNAFGRQLSKLSSLNFKPNNMRSGEVPTPPEELRCPISLQLMYDPVIISSGQTYERVCIVKWFKDGHASCPKTQQQLAHLSLIPNYCVKGLISSWCEQNGVPVPDCPPASVCLNYWRLSFSDHDASDCKSLDSINSFHDKGVEQISLDENVGTKEQSMPDESFSDNNSSQESEVDELERCESLLSVLGDCDKRKQQKAVEEIRFLLKDDAEARIYLGANGCVEALVQFLKLAIDDGDEIAQEVGALALFNLAVNNDRNKEMILSAAVIPLLDKMISNPKTRASATALYLNLSCLERAKPIIGSSCATPTLVQVLLPESSHSISCKHDALFCLFNLSTHVPTVSLLLDAGIVNCLLSLLTNFEAPTSCTWSEKALAVLNNIASSPVGMKEMVSTPGLISSITTALDTGQQAVQEQAVSCLLALCNGDEKCCQMALQEGVIPSLVYLSGNGTNRGKETAQKLLKLFRERRQRDPSPVRVRIEAVGGGSLGEMIEPKPMDKSRSTRFVRALSSFWKSKHTGSRCNGGYL